MPRRNLGETWHSVNPSANGWEPVRPRWAQKEPARRALSAYISASARASSVATLSPARYVVMPSAAPDLVPAGHLGPAAFQAAPQPAEGRGRAGAAGVLEQDDELVAAEAGDGVDAAGGGR